MNEEEKMKEMLALCRPGTSEMTDARAQEALQDPAIREWYREHASSYRSIRAKFNAVPIPPDLKARIVGGYPAYRAKIVPFQSWKFLRIAASIVLCAGLAIFSLTYHRQSAGFDVYRTRMVRTALRGYAMDMQSSDFRTVNDFLTGHNSPTVADLPAHLKPAQLVGCAILHWQGASVSMICFRSGHPLAGGENTDLWLFVVNQSSVANAPKSSLPLIEQVKNLETATWNQNGKTFVLAANGSETFLREFL